MKVMADHQLTGPPVACEAWVNATLWYRACSAQDHRDIRLYEPPDHKVGYVGPVNG
jgi:hypothetical protein